MYRQASLYFFFVTIVTLFCTIFSVQVSFAQNGSFTVKGKVVRKDTKEAIPYATVIIDSASKGVTTDFEGKYIIKNLSKNTIALTASCIGFEDVTLSVSSNSNKEVIFELEEAAVSLEEVVVEGASEASKIKSQGYSAQVVEMGQLETQSVQMNDLLDHSSGIRVRQSGGLGSTANYNINGLGGNSIRFFLDGIPMEYFGRAYSISNIPVNLIDRVEVYKGVVPAYLGSDALGGAINVVTKENVDTALDFSYSVGSFNTHEAVLNGMWRDAKSGFSVKGSMFYNYSDNNYKVWGDNIAVSDPDGTVHRGMKVERFNDAFYSYAPKIDLGFTQKWWADQFYVGMLYTDMYKEIQHGATMDVPYGERHYTQSNFTPSASYKKKDFILKGLDATAFASYTMMQRHTVDTTTNRYNWYGEVRRTDQTPGERGAATLQLDEINTLVSRANLNYNISENTQFGVNYVYTDSRQYTNDPLAETSRQDLIGEQRISKQNLGFNLQNEAFEGRWKTSIFAKHFSYRVDVEDAEKIKGQWEPYVFSKTDQAWGYGAATSFALTNYFMLTSSVEQAVRMPEVNEVFGNVADNLEASYNLKPEQSFNINAGFNLGPFYMGEHKLSWNNNFFYRDTKDQILLALSGKGTTEEAMVYENVGKAISKGWDTEVSYSFMNRLFLDFTLSYLDARNKMEYDANGYKNIYYNNRLRNVPYFQMSNRVRYEIPNFLKQDDGFSINWSYNYVHEFFLDWEALGNNNKAVIPTQTVHNLGVGYKFPNRKIALNVDVRNIMNTQVFDNYGVQRPGRGVYFKLNYNIL
ncbi:TonB-dependent receptor [Sediminitomix flava]|uniref:Outer membrane receptor protein involved in Fe transport n=1 Tax=Sediminitomix flava TaxID=379075 RepID=A0A315ZCC0_SEDFL|nr:TonB-dependent receptor [Sediminitomix flava]PWJ43225.1 outer membrane receptor protein involved in Fe transport [Sediminitomix flava]